MNLMLNLFSSELPIILIQKKRGDACLNWELYRLCCNSPGWAICQNWISDALSKLEPGNPSGIAFALCSILSNRLVESLLAPDPNIVRFARRSILLLASVGSPPFSPAAFPAKTQATLPVMCRYLAIRLHDYERHDDQ